MYNSVTATVLYSVSVFLLHCMYLNCRPEILTIMWTMKTRQIEGSEVVSDFA